MKVFFLFFLIVLPFISATTFWSVQDSSGDVYGALDLTESDFKLWYSQFPKIVNTTISSCEIDIVADRDTLLSLYQHGRLTINSITPLHTILFKDFVNTVVANSETPRDLISSVTKKAALQLFSMYSGVDPQKVQYEPNLSIEEYEKRALIVLNWVKSYIKWYNQECLVCGYSKTSFLGMQAPNATEKKIKCDYDTEVYHCPSCGSYYRFPRFRNFTQLAHQAFGRCSEHSKVFYTVMEALGYTPRYIVCYCNHVWVELFLNNAWYHTDPSEAFFNNPYVYETHWGWKLNWIFGHEPTSVVDVLSRYTHHYSDCIKRRAMSQETLDKILNEANEILNG
ncbi:peptide-n(4)-(n-acetyl-beta-glucosaminyl)asparagine amidase [Anaeramoeba flamelloides]|uniref:Peptide-n(4)-(N-acetyl-beta-glucosaminyl)asparagine amidase n=1 Tax=Anaeramoeba flamelloides TaxID=1746091 RepID=A0AAV7Y6J6_9EUKA|nr:peptide-n(4)-(n-acetyl-beta-glucosaminyl)asparagine amidase [Anaeramoeba flamelloides]